MYVMVSGCSVSECEFNSNFLTGANVQPCGGAAMGVMWSDDLAVTTINSCSFIKNKSYEWGGAISNFWGNLEINDCVFSRNVTYDSNDDWSSPEGGGIFSIGGELLLQNCLFTANAATGESFFTRGGAMCIDYKCQPALRNCTFADNTASFSGGGIYGTYDINTITLENCIFWNNTDRNGAVESAQIYGCNDIVIDYSCVQGWTGTFGGVGNIGADPCFVSGPEGDYYLSQIAAGQLVDSPCVDAGSDTAATLGLDMLTTRTDGVGDSGTVDMGYHYAPPNPADFDGDGVVNFLDFAVLGEAWMSEFGDLNWDPACDISEPEDDVIDGLDIAVFVGNWLEGL
jgi:predicted outer membrane repeat protein